LYIKANTVLNYEAKTNYSVTVNVDDTTVGSTPDATTNFTLTVTDVNEAPTAVSLTNQQTAIAENTSTATRIKVTDIGITDDGLGTNNLSLSGADASFFEVDATGLYIKANTVLNYEAKTNYSVTVNVDDTTVGSTPDATTNFTLTVTDVNEAPTALSLSANSINENVAINSTVGTFSSTDPDSSDAFTYSLVTGTGSTNNSSFTIVNNELRLKISPNFETKASYLVRVRSTDAGGLFTESPFTITINNLTTNTITGTTANETFAATNELDSIDGDGGNDNITATVVNLQSGESFNGNTGVDTFTLSQGNLTDVVNFDLSLTNQLISLTGVSGVTLSNFENINIAGFKGSGTLSGSNVANILTGGVSGDTINGGDGNDNINGGAGNDILNGDVGNDVLNGSVGTDTMTGGTGNDAYYIDNVGDTITELSGEGTDIVYSTLDYSLVGTNLENLGLQGTAINGTGNEFNNSIAGNASNNILSGGIGNDVLNGGVGADSLTGGTGNDAYYIDNVGDTITELSGEGTDTVYSTLDYSLVGTNLENLGLQGTAINGTGNEFNNSITGNASNNVLSGGAGNDVLNGSTGADSLIGGTGNDVYYIENAGDTITELSGEGTETVYSTLDYTFVGTYLENLVLQGTAINGTGNELNNSITGNSSNNILSGGAGNDTLNGSTGADILTGEGGNDLLYLGSDTVTDTVNYASGDGVDTVYNFVRGVGGDVLNFVSILTIDVQVSGSNTLFKVGDGITGNSGFGSGALLLTTIGTTTATSVFVAADVNVHLFGATFAFS
jgi:Ca2+-binding RTX toxin-like protein